jgi:hypothetical protein
MFVNKIMNFEDSMSRIDIQKIYVFYSFKKNYYLKILFLNNTKLTNDIYIYLMSKMPRDYNNKQDG